MTRSLTTELRRASRLLQKTGLKVVFAESCTAGLVSASLARVPGISDFHCGGMVVYRNGTKEAYLGIPASLLKNPGPVSDVVAREMALRVLKLTPEADVSATVTGHLGPGAPAELDGMAYIAVAASRTQEGMKVSSRSKSKHGKQSPAVVVHRYQCKTTKRVARQKEVTAAVLAQLADVLESF